MDLAKPGQEEVRRALGKRLAVDAPGTLIEEFWVPLSNERADLVVLNGCLQAFEIKTARDRLTRLPRQVKAYDRVFDFCTAVVAERHSDDVVAALPDHWGLVVFDHHDTSTTFDWVRRAKRNPEVDAVTLVRLLWRDEACSALARMGSPPRPGSSRAWLWNELLGRVDVEQLRGLVRDALTDRDPAAARIPTRRFARVGSSGRWDLPQLIGDELQVV